MAMEFKNTGFINFNKEYNKKLKSGSLTASMSTSVKDKGEWVTKYFNIVIVGDKVKEVGKFIKENTLVDVTGFAVPSKKGYISLIVTDVKEHISEDEEGNLQRLELVDEEGNLKRLELVDDDLPF